VFSIYRIGDLHFAYARQSDQLPDDKVYKCVVFNPHLDLRAGGSYTSITVQPPGRAGLPDLPDFTGETAFQSRYLARPIGLVRMSHPRVL